MSQVHNAHVLNKIMDILISTDACKFNILLSFNEIFQGHLVRYSKHQENRAFIQYDKLQNLLKKLSIRLVFLKLKQYDQRNFNENHYLNLWKDFLISFYHIFLIFFSLTQKLRFILLTKDISFISLLIDEDSSLEKTLLY